MKPEDAYSIADSFSSLLSPSDAYAFGYAVQQKLDAFDRACIVTFGDGTSAIACLAQDGSVTFLTYDDPMLYETAYQALDGAVWVESSRLLPSPRAFLEDGVLIKHPALPGGSVKIDAIPRSGTSSEGAGEAIADALR